MDNIRLIPIKLFEDDYFCSLDYFSRLIWMGLVIACADDQGRFIDNVTLIQSKIFMTHRDIRDNQIENILTGFSNSGKIIRYEANNKKLIQIIDWKKYQNLYSASPSKYPPPHGWVDMVKCHKQEYDF